MSTSKPILLIGNLMFSIVLVYGLAFISNVFGKSYLFENGIMDLGYVFLTLAIALPCMVYCILANGHIIKVLCGAMMFVSLFFILVYLFAFGAGSTPLTIKIETRFVSIYFLLTIIFISITHLEFNRKA